MKEASPNRGFQITTGRVQVRLQPSREVASKSAGGDEVVRPHRPAPEAQFNLTVIRVYW